MKVLLSSCTRGLLSYGVCAHTLAAQLPKLQVPGLSGMYVLYRGQGTVLLLLLVTGRLASRDKSHTTASEDLPKLSRLRFLGARPGGESQNLSLAVFRLAVST